MSSRKRLLQSAAVGFERHASLEDDDDDGRHNLDKFSRRKRELLSSVNRDGSLRTKDGKTIRREEEGVAPTLVIPMRGPSSKAAQMIEAASCKGEQKEVERDDDEDDKRRKKHRKHRRSRSKDKDDDRKAEASMLEVDVSEEAADYSAVAIESFGEAMLRGMGWSGSKQGIGLRHAERPAASIEASLRPKGMGLGADKTNKKVEAPSVTNKDGKSEKLVAKKGAHVVILGGPNKDRYATIKSIDEENCRYFVDIAGQSSTLSQHQAQLVTPDEFQKYSKYLNKRTADMYKEEEERAKDDDHKKHKKKSKKEKKRRRSSSSSRERSLSPASKKDAALSAIPLPTTEFWLYPDTIVHVLRSARLSECQGTQGLVSEVITPNLCVIKAPGLSQAGAKVSSKHLRPFAPTSIGQHAIALQGRKKGCIGKVLEMTDKCVALDFSAHGSDSYVESIQTFKIHEVCLAAVVS